MRLDRLHRAHPSLHPFGVVHWVPDQLNIKAVTRACKLIDGCSLKSCVRPHLQWHHLAYAAEIKVNSTAWLYRGPSRMIVSITLHYITLHYITLHYITLHYITLHYITLHYITLHYITLHYITLHYITLHNITLHYITLHYITLQHITLHYITTHYITLHYSFPGFGIQLSYNSRYCSM